MRTKSVLGMLCLVLAGASAAAGLSGVVDLVAGCVGAVPVAILGGVLFVLGKVDAGFDNDVARVRELPTQGVRLEGRVVDALPYASRGGGAVFQAEGAQMVLQVELPNAQGGTRRVQVHVVEPSEAARARIGTNVTVLEHPLDPALRALEGFLPNGRRNS